MKKARKTSLRTCAGCGETIDKRHLVRIVRTAEGHAVVDPTGKANGRGTYLCPKNDCFDAAMQRKRLDSALRVRLQDDDVDRLRREFARTLDSLKPAQQGR